MPPRSRSLRESECGGHNRSAANQGGPARAAFRNLERGALACLPAAEAVLVIAFVSGSGTTRAIAMATEGALVVPDVGRVLCHPKDSRASALSA
jgi:hypothetical protein